MLMIAVISMLMVMVVLMMLMLLVWWSSCLQLWCIRSAEATSAISSASRESMIAGVSCV